MKQKSLQKRINCKMMKVLAKVFLLLVIHLQKTFQRSLFSSVSLQTTPKIQRNPQNSVFKQRRVFKKICLFINNAIQRNPQNSVLLQTSPIFFTDSAVNSSTIQLLIINPY